MQTKVNGSADFVLHKLTSYVHFLRKDKKVTGGRKIHKRGENYTFWSKTQVENFIGTLIDTVLNLCL
ncbi:hypothetical protein D0T50_12215 [Bacteroides sp. 214]|nr:hypothetical protein [Bacteroides sp. 214]